MRALTWPMRAIGPAFRRCGWTGLIILALATGGTALGATAVSAASTVSWSPVPIQAPPGGVSNSDLLSLGNVTCLAASDCVVGGYLESLATVPAVYHPVIWHWNGHVWGYESAGTVGSAGLVGTACVSASECWVVGGRFVGKQGNQSVGLIEEYNGKSWSRAAFPSAAGAAFNGVACASASFCVAGGEKQTSTDAAHVLFELWNGKAWAPMAAPSPAGSLWSVVDSLTCFSPGDCLALGDYDTSTKGTGYFFADKLTGAVWSMVPVQNANKFNMGNESGLFEISCPSASDCLAVGSILGYTAGQEGADFAGGAAEKWNGASWQAVTPAPKSPPGPDQTSLILYGSSCPAGGGCYAVGGYPSIVGTLSHGIPVLSWNGSAFTVGALTEKGFLAGISCLKENVGTWCIALGEKPVGTKVALTAGDFLAAGGKERS